MTTGPTPEQPQHFPQCVPVLQGDGVRLRAHDYDDIDRIVEQSQDEVSQRFIPLPNPYTVENARGFLAEFVEKSWNERKRFEFAIDDLSAQESLFCGNVGVWPHGDGRYEVGWILHPDARGRGIMTRAVELVLAWAFESLDARVGKWCADADNDASWAVARRVGFREPVVLPNWMPLGGELRHCAQATLTREQFENGTLA
jgi:RimJ/RimL family protein N-acetyltransferase